VNLRFTSVPEPQSTRAYIEQAVAQREAGNRLAFAVHRFGHRPCAGQLQLPRHRAGD
jgi:hypothetical protein